MKKTNRQQAVGNSKSYRFIWVTIGALLLALCSSVRAQQPKKVARIGYLNANPPSASPARTEAFRQGLRELGYVEGKNIFIEYRSAETKLDRLPTLAAELVRLPVEIIVTAGPASTRAAKQSTATIPIVMGFDDDPVGSGYAASLARPGGNVTGLSTLAPEITGKQLDLLREVVPRLSRLAVLGNATQLGNPQALREITMAADAVRVQLQYLEVKSANDLETAFGAATKEHAEGVLLLAGPVFLSQRKKIADLAAKGKLPTISSRSEYVEDGGLLFYGAKYTDLFRRIATYVDKILKGANPADLPVEQPKKFELVINLRAAKQIGLTIPPNVLARADRVIR
jgi:putative ABC transport system substrate-binding protein